MFDHPWIFIVALGLFWLAALAITALHGGLRSGEPNRLRTVHHNHSRYRYMR